MSGILLGKTMGRGGSWPTASPASRAASPTSRSARAWRAAGEWRRCRPRSRSCPRSCTCSPGVAGERLDRHRGGVHHPPDAAAVPDQVAAGGRRRRAELDGAVRPHLRVPRPAGRDHERAGPTELRAGRRGEVALRGRAVSLRRRSVDAATSTSTVGRGRRRRSWARPGRARRRSATSSRGCTTPRRRVALDGDDIRNVTFGSLAATPSASCHRTPTCSMRRARQPAQQLLLLLLLSSS